jgi:hypothetical protein
MKARITMNKLKTTDTQFTHLYEVLDTSRKNSETVKVNREALSNLLIDHSELQTKVNRNGQLTNSPDSDKV